MAVNVQRLCTSLAALPELRLCNVVNDNRLAFTIHCPKDVDRSKDELASIKAGNLFLFVSLMLPGGQGYDAFVKEMQPRLPDVPGGWSTSPSSAPQGGPTAFADFVASFRL